MIYALIIIGLLLAAETWFLLAGVRGENISETRGETIEFNWQEFLDWVQDARKIKSVSEPYEYWNERNKDGVSHYVPLANEHNFWLWFLDYKWEKKSASIKSKKRPTSKDKL